MSSRREAQIALLSPIGSDEERSFQRILTGSSISPSSSNSSPTRVGDTTPGTPDQKSTSNIQRKPVPSTGLIKQDLQPHVTQVEKVSKSPAVGTGVNQNGQPLERFIPRALLSILVPIALLIYYILTYMRWLRYPDNSGDAWIVQGYLDNAELVNYSWFVLAAFGLNLGTYSLSGSVASMVMTGWWTPKNARVLLELAASSFADPSAWMKSIWKVIRNRSTTKENNGQLWNLLSLLNIIGFVAWPLAGLTMQTVDGVELDLRGGLTGATVLGRNESTFNQRNAQLLLTRETRGRTNGFAGRLPRGQLYTLEGSSTPLNITTQNMMPDDATTPIFLAPQADQPYVGGRIFGLLVSYNCSIVNSTSEFTILNQREDLSTFVPGVPSYDSGLYYPAGDRTNGSTIVTLVRVNTSILSVEGYRFHEQLNLNGTMEVGVSIPFYNLTNTRGDRYGSYANGERIPGINKPVLLEVALWQEISGEHFFEDYYTSPITNVTVQGLEGYELRDLRGIYGNQTAIGCRCYASSDIGFADVDGTRAVYSNFTPTELGKPDPEDYRTAPLRFEHGVFNRLISARYWIIDTLRLLSTFGSIPGLFTDWYYSLLTTTGFFWRGRRYDADGQDYSTSVMQAEDLRQTLLRIHHSYALQLMYDGTDDTSLSWYHPNVTLSRPQKVLVRGVLAPEVVLAIFAVWTLAIATLSALYQFRRRWTAKLNTFNMFVLGLNIDEQVDIRPEDLIRGGKKKLEMLPGTIGDLNADGQVGSIGLTRNGSLARRSKSYV
ncbi:hypothetical protein H072_1051 [Dactylellina haptotyla CBS 200.50]|uniref:Uncharacterized protein n=1 Tax=Dactylellina haptotyla (strain CBS 200.50) TaxID=1284197 RepID=S8CBB3_DACHA|nr:hypothetical protein H072_1051 [Dactylellina haptotyla CBS 200.50]